MSSASCDAIGRGFRSTTDCWFCNSWGSVVAPIDGDHGNLERSNWLLVPCPNCGHITDDERRKSRRANMKLRCPRRTEESVEDILRRAQKLAVHYAKLRAKGRK